jgi:hypothetical protein
MQHRKLEKMSAPGRPCAAWGRWRALPVVAITALGAAFGCGSESGRGGQASSETAPATPAANEASSSPEPGREGGAMTGAPVEATSSPSTGPADEGNPTGSIGLVGGETPNPESGSPGVGAGGASGNSDGAGGYTYWPNPDSHSNSDPWLRENHPKLVQLRPKVLVIDVQRTGRPILDVVQAAARDVGEGSRYHGYSDAQAPVFVDYQIDKVVDLRDPSAEYPDFWPPTPFDTGALFAPEFASRWGYKDPDDGHDLPLCEIFERGLANELWIAAEAGTRNVYENQSYVQIYDDQLQPTGRFSKCTNGCFSDPGRRVNCKVTVRIQEVNKNRGTGCFTHAQGHAIENEGARIPYLASNAARFFYRDMKARYGIGYNSLYEMSCAGNADSTIFGRNGCLSFPTPGHMLFDPQDLAKPSVDFTGFGQGCGDVHHSANVDWSTTLQALTACEGYAMGQGAGAEDATTVYTTAVSRALHPTFDDDCGGRWQLYMRQSIPGLNNAAKDSEGNPMKNWWVFWYY